MIDRWFDNYGGGLSARFVDRIDELVRRELPGVLDSDTHTGCTLAAALRDNLIAEANLAGDLLRPQYGSMFDDTDNDATQR
jgi:hypothetical protein